MSKRAATSHQWLFTPPPGAKNPRVVSCGDLDCDRKKEENGKENTNEARRNLSLGFGSSPASDGDLPVTQEPSYTQETTREVPATSGTCYGTLKDVYDESCSFDITKTTIGIGRSRSMDLQIEEGEVFVSSRHCELTLDGDEYFGNTATLVAVKNCWVCYPHQKTWEQVQAGTHSLLVSGSHFRLVRPGSKSPARKPRQEFRLQVHALPTARDRPKPGTHSFDCQYLKLLKAILEGGQERKNTKGANHTLQRSFELKIDLFDEGGRYLLPVTSLRNMFNGKYAILEALWYLRGEDHVRFLQENGCKFWNQQCGENGLVGWNYGLLTSFPRSNGERGCNQLEEKVLKPLCKLGSQSRNLVCTLLKPDERTVQISCTSVIQFSVQMTDNNECLDLTVTQRSSDTVLGLPNDVIVWSVILHLVCRDVYIRTNGKRNLRAGTLYFHINAGGAHVYTMNMENAGEILKRNPIEDCQPRLNILGNERNIDIPLSRHVKPVDMFQVVQGKSLLAKYPDAVRVQGYGSMKRHPAIKIKQAA